MKKHLNQTVYKASNIIEFFISLLIILVIAILSLELVKEVAVIITKQRTDDVLIYFLEKALSLVIGIEFVKMLCNHKPGTVVEVLLFALARQMIVEHLTVKEIFVGVISMAILFAIRKYLLIKADE